MGTLLHYHSISHHHLDRMVEKKTQTTDSSPFCTNMFTQALNQAVISGCGMAPPPPPCHEARQGVLGEGLTRREGDTDTAANNSCVICRVAVA